MLMPANSHPLAPVFAQLSASGYLHVCYQPEVPTTPLYERLATPWLAAQIAAQAKDRPGLDLLGQGAFFIGRLSYVFGLVWAAGSELAGQAPALANATLDWQPEQVALTVHDTELVSTEQLRAHIIAVMTPIVQAVAKHSRLSPGAQWSLISDSLASAWLMVGEQVGQASQAQASVLSLLHDGKSRLRNRRTGFEHYQAYGGQQLLAQQTLRTRAGCCRKYTDDGEYCSTCVHLDSEQRRARVEQTLWQQHQPTHVVVQP